jgi:hypothetical protein
MTINDSTRTEALRKIRKRYLPFHEVGVGMVLAEPVRIADRHVVRFTLPAEHALTEVDLRQLAAHGTEYLCIALPDTRSEAAVAAETAAAAARVAEIFAGADLGKPAVGALYRRVLAYRSH